MSIRENMEKRNIVFFLIFAKKQAEADADAIDSYLKGQGKQIKGNGEEVTQTLLKFNGGCLEKTSRVEVPELPISERSLDREDFLGLDLSKIEAEAIRCFNCGCATVNVSDIGTALVALSAKIKTTKRTINAEEFFTARPMKSTILDIDKPEIQEEVRENVSQICQRFPVPGIDD